eukprot:gnl/TRDRNA2_/TRDRNA2_174911_c11_seq1.p1 gnl/TRDRNA2_/TRDRNA2_174911_c11~~gnl/TRDRNA2_/TRDRNA2_174911_c11_seq1.p1  ORF type:complete len:334 (-),score=46.59 gnl/TRDRNA2_/TRDRNA2_174911_c11_seq1:20-988(-)
MPLLPRCPSAPLVHTVIFVGVDGVLNVRMRNPTWDILRQECASDESIFGTKVVSVYQVPGEDAGDTLERYLGECSSPKLSSFPSRLVGRLASLIQAAGERQDVAVILSSDTIFVNQLEKALARHLGVPSFAFDGLMPVTSDNPRDRLKSLKSEISNLPPESCTHSLRVLVLDDLLCSPLDWKPKSIEKYLVAQVPSSIEVAVKFVHTYDEWKTPDGLSVQIGTGIEVEHMHQAERFLRGEANLDLDSEDENGLAMGQFRSIRSQCSLRSDDFGEGIQSISLQSMKSMDSIKSKASVMSTFSCRSRNLFAGLRSSFGRTTISI